MSGAAGRWVGHVGCVSTVRLAQLYNEDHSLRLGLVPLFFFFLSQAADQEVLLPPSPMALDVFSSVLLQSAGLCDVRVVLSLVHKEGTSRWLISPLFKKREKNRWFVRCQSSCSDPAKRKRRLVRGTSGSSLLVGYI